MNLTEQWKKEYKAFLKEQEYFNKEADDVFNELAEESEYVNKGYQLLEQYYGEFNLLENPEDPQPMRAGDIPYSSPAPAGMAPRREENRLDGAYGIGKTITDILTHFDGTDKPHNYKPSATFTYQKVSNMKFPANIIFFITQIISWAKNVVIYIVEKIKNLIRIAFGDKPHQLDASALKLNLKKAKQIEQVATAIDLGRGGDDIIKPYSIAASEIEKIGGFALREASLGQLLGIDKGVAKDAVREVPVVVTIDLARDIANLKELLQHFLDLYDNAYGSRNENLFGTDDLEIVLQIMEETLSRLKKGDTALYSLSGGNPVEAAGVNSARVKDNLILTNENINNLKVAYVQTASKIKDLTKVINSKEMYMLSDLGVSYAILSSSTQLEMNDILEKILPTRIKSAQEAAANLDKLSRQYKEFIDTLKDMQKSVLMISNITYDSTFNKKIIDLLNSARYMSDIVTLRLSGIGLYIKELKDIQGILTMIAKTAQNINQ